MLDLPIPPVLAANRKDCRYGRTRVRLRGADFGHKEVCLSADAVGHGDAVEGPIPHLGCNSLLIPLIRLTQY